jgi:PAS domain S-box-containing protein
MAMLEKIDKSAILKKASVKPNTHINQADLTPSAADLDCKILAATFNSIGDAVIATDTNAHITRLNLAAEKLTGWAQKEAIGRPVDEILYMINAETRQPVISPVLKTLAQGVISYLPKKSLLVSRDGHEHAIGDSCAPIINLDGTIEGAVIIFRDTTQQESVQTALRTSEELFRSTFENASVGIVHIGRDGQSLRANKQFSRMVGYSVAELLFNPCQKITHPDDLAENLAGYESLLAGDIDSFSMEKRYIRKDKSILWADLEVGCARDANHEIEYFIAVVEDISTRKQAIEDSRRFFTLSQELLCTAGFDGYFKKLNSTWEKVLGYSLDELLAKPFIEFVHPDDQEKTRIEAEKLMSGKDVVDFENRYCCKNGEVRWLLWSVVSVVSEQLLYASARDITERKKIEQALQIRNLQFECLISAAPFGIHLLDEDFRILQVNPYALPAFGDVPNLIGRDFGEVIHLIWPTDKANEVIRQFRHTLETGESSVVAEMIEQRVDRETFECYAWEIHRIPLPSGKHGVVCYFQDISTRVLAQRAIVESEARYRTLFNGMDEGYCVIEVIFDAQQKPIDYRFLEINPPFEAQSGLVNAVGKSILELIPDFDPIPIAMYGQVALTGEPTRFEYDVKELNRCFDIYAFKFESPENNKVAILFTNISARKQAEHALKNSEERLKAFVMSSSDVIYSMSPDWRVMHQMHGREFIADSVASNADWLQQYIHPSNQLEVHATIKKAIQNKTVFEMEHQILQADESLGWTFSRAVPILNNEGEITEWFGTATNVTQRKLEQTALREVQETLVSNNLELQAAKLAAEKANFAKSEFLSRMTHELRTPLNSILGFAQLIESGAAPLTVSQSRNIHQIVQAGWYLLELINEILDLAQIESGQQAMLLEPLAVNELMRECATLVEPLALKHNIGITFNALADSAIVHADKTRFKQIMINLLSNAIKYNKVGGTVIVDFALSQNVLRICVQDTGLGLNEEELAQLFQPFNRLSRQANLEEGTGIGLIVCKRLIEMMNGTIGVQSTVGEGSEFWIELDLADEITQASKAEQHAHKMEFSENSITNNITITSDD